MVRRRGGVGVGCVGGRWLLAMRSAFGLPTLVRTRRWDPAADSANSTGRGRYADAFQPILETRKNNSKWLTTGTSSC